MNNLIKFKFCLVFINLLVFLFISFIECNQILKRRKRLDVEPQDMEYFAVDSDPENDMSTGIVTF